MGLLRTMLAVASARKWTWTIGTTTPTSQVRVRAIGGEKGKDILRNVQIEVCPDDIALEAERSRRVDLPVVVHVVMREVEGEVVQTLALKGREVDSGI